MALDTNCILNVGDYYSAHYLDTTFTSDVKAPLEAWGAAGSAAPTERVKALTSVYFRVKAEAQELAAPETRTGGVFRNWNCSLLEALGFSGSTPAAFPVEGGDAEVFLLGLLHRHDRPWLALAESTFCLPETALPDGAPDEDPMAMPAGVSAANRTPRADDWSRAAALIFKEEEAPRWLLLLGGCRVLLLDGHTYAEGRYLAFDLEEAFGRPTRDGFRALALFLSRDTLCPEGEAGEVLHERLESQSHKFAHAVSGQLQLAVRDAIELLANEWVFDRKERQKDRYTDLKPEVIKREALIFVYRLLFCFYAEAHGAELGLLPMDDDDYRLGYSLESLRDLEQVPLTTGEATDGLYFHEHLRRLFQLVHKGFHPTRSAEAGGLFDDADEQLPSFSLPPLTATLFDPAQTPLFERARFRNACLQQVIARLSLSEAPRTGRRGRTVERVNYAALGINQLGSVYEGLLSYRGIFATEDMIRVRRAKDKDDPTAATWFVPHARLSEFHRDEVERLADGRERIYKSGEFYLSLSGLERKQLASHYTPEVLTRCLVGEVLRQFCPEGEPPPPADRILSLKVCEPAMGSGAFLLEAARQLADLYLKLKQAETSEHIPPEEMHDERHRVMHYLATRNFYGVDLNETAVELGSLSLWLGSIHRLRGNESGNGSSRTRPGAPPWFGLRLRRGNSLIGARRAVWTRKQLLAGAHASGEGPAPRLLAPGEARGEDEVYQFLVFDPEMVPAAGDALMRQFHPDACAQAAQWRRDQVRPRWAALDVERALRLSRTVDRLWDEYGKARARALDATAGTASVWPLPSSDPRARATGPSLADQERLKRDLEAGSGAFQRLKLVLDSWCALWFWPLAETGVLPDRAAWLAVTALLLGEPPPRGDWSELELGGVGVLVDSLTRAAGGSAPDVPTLEAAVPWLPTVRRVGREQPFQHWELAFPEVLGPKGAGFDLVLGNPPWVPVSWNDAPVLGELDPLVGVREPKSAELGEHRTRLLAEPKARARYSDQFTLGEGAAAFLNSRRVYSPLAGIQSNTYKNFIVRSWEILGPLGFAGLLHPDGVFDDPVGGHFRARYFQHLRIHHQFRNEASLFRDIDHHNVYSINVFQGVAGDIGFECLFNLFDPATIDRCRRHDGHGLVPGIKTGDGAWDTSGHANRILRINEPDLRLFARLLDDVDTPWQQARLPQVHASDLLEVLRCFAEAPQKLADLRG